MPRPQHRPPKHLRRSGWIPSRPARQPTVSVVNATEIRLPCHVRGSTWVPTVVLCYAFLHPPMSIQFRFAIPAILGLVLLGLVTYALAATIYSRSVEQEFTRRNEVVLAAVDREVLLASQHAVSIANIMAAIPSVLDAYEKAHHGNMGDESDATVQSARADLRQRMERYIKASS